MDLLCHGVPSPRLFHEHLDNSFGGKERIADVEFRSREGWAVLFRVKLKNGEVKTLYNNKSVYIQSFLQDINLRASCFQCNYSKVPRQGDIFTESINYDDIHQRINAARKESVEWLHSALNIEIKSHKDNNSADLILKLLKSLRDQTELFDKFKRYYTYEEGQKEEINVQLKKGKTWYEVICLKNNIIPENSKLKEMSRLQEYFTFLKENSKYLIVLSGADECSIHWAKFVEASGLMLRKDIRWRESYVAIIDDGTVKIDEKSKEEININYTFAAGHPKCSMEYMDGHLKVDCMPLERCRIRVKSKGYTEPTGAYKSEIVVDNIDYSINKIGINVVVIDKETGKVDDSINVNTYSDGTLKINRS